MRVLTEQQQQIKSFCEILHDEDSETFQNFLDAVKTESTKKQYIYYLDKYFLYLKDILESTNDNFRLSHYDQLIPKLDNGDPDNKAIQKHLDNYLHYLRELKDESGKSKYSRTLVNVQFNALYLFYDMNDVLLNKRKLSKRFPVQEEEIGGNGYTHEDLRKLLEEANRKTQRKNKQKLKKIAMIYFLASSGMRIGGLAGLRWLDVTPYQNCMKVVVYAGTKYKYITFISPQAVKALIDYRDSLFILNLNKSDFIFGNNIHSLTSLLSRLVKSAEIRTKTKELTYDKPLFHAFRKFFETTMKGIPQIKESYISMMTGHKQTLETAYNRPSDQLLFETYLSGLRKLKI